MPSKPDTVEQELFGHRESTTPNDAEVSVLFEQYKLIVGTSEALVSRRQHVNTFFLSVNSILLAAIGLLLRENAANSIVGPAFVILGTSGMILCYTWSQMILSFRQLNRGKFDVIHALERRLPARIFAAEWDALGRGKNPSKYKPFTTTERWLPRIMGCLELVVFVVGIGLWVCGLQNTN